jgi:hypothetical protein
MSLFLVWSCAQSRPAQTSPASDKKPSWLEGQSKRYPNAFYITGVGSGYTRATAENNARANIGKVFKVDIKSRTRTVKTETIKNLTQSQLREQTRDQIDASLNKTLQGTEIQDIWQEPDSRRYFAFAVLERDLARSILTERLKEIDITFETQRTLSKSANTRLKQIRAYVACKNLLQTRQTINSDLRVVSMDNKGLQPPYNIGNEQAAIDQFLYNEVKLGVVAAAGTPKETTKKLMQQITNKGFVVKAAQEGNMGDFDIIFRLGLDLNTPNEKVDDWYYTAWSLSLKAMDATKNTVLASDVADGRSGQLSKARAEQKARFDAEKKLSAIAGSVLSGVFGD